MSKSTFISAIALSCFFPSILIAQSQLHLPTLHVKDKKTSENHISHFANFSVNYKAPALKQMGASTLTQFLKTQHIANIHSSGANPNNSVISMHGFGNNAELNSKLLIDGIPMSSFSMLGPNLNMVLLNNINSLNITPGSLGTLYGSGAVGGVVNIETYKPTLTPKGDIGFALGNMGQRQIHGFYSQRFHNHVGISIGTRFNHSDNGQPHSKTNQFVTNGKIDYIGKSDYISLNWITYKNRAQYPKALIWSGKELNLSSNTSAISSGNLMYLNNLYYINPNLSLTSKLLYDNTREDSSVMDSHITQHGFFLQNHINWKKAFLAGIDFSTQHYNNINTYINNTAREYIASVYSQASLALKHHLHFILGGRLAKQWLKIHSNAISGHVTPSVFVSEQGFTYTPNSHWQWFIKRDGNYRFATGKERLWSTNNLYTIQTQTGTSYETGFNWHNSKARIASQFYILDLKNELAMVNDPLPNGHLINLAPTRRIGLDSNASIDATTWLTLSASLNIVSPRFLSGRYKGDQIPGVSPINAGVISTFHLPHHMTLALNENMNSAYYAMEDNYNTQGKLPAVWLTNLNFSKNFSHMRFSVSIDNVLNHHYPRYAIYQNFIPTTMYYPSNGISVLCAIDFTLGNNTHA